MVEVRVLRMLGERDPENHKRCIQMKDCFEYRNHVCIVTGLLGMSVFDFLKGNGFEPFPGTHIREFAEQLFRSVACKDDGAVVHELSVVHTDLKPENILLVDAGFRTVPYGRRGQRVKRLLKNTEIRLIDFGSATFEDEYHSSVVSTRHYRAPEIILGRQMQDWGWGLMWKGWGGRIRATYGAFPDTRQSGASVYDGGDLWKAGAEADKTVFVRECVVKSAQKYFRHSGKLDYPNKDTSPSSRKFVKTMRPLAEIVPSTSALNIHFLDLLTKIFIYDPSKRITAREALSHPYFFSPITHLDTI
ncbi:hypothetical protein PMAC_000120 [Pneumocystis sp. 'macacae']|nr:hypothetical protein PMAC_000120 [Pneumocystis sp. 'macacae']